VAFEPLSKKSLGTSVFDQLCDRIVDGTLQPGERLPAERVLAERLGVNRQAVREGLGRLEQIGLVQTRMGGGTRILDYKRTAGLELMARLLITRRGIDAAMVRSVLEMRRSMGREISRLCARRRDDDTVTKLHAVVRQLEHADGDVQSQQSLALSFWEVVVRGSGNLAYRLAFNSLEAAYGQVMQHMSRLMADEVSAVEDYAALAKAVERRNETAAVRACERIVARGEAAMDELLGALEQEGAS
jgi:DNA-binding FadR family transcriptional regulator